MASAEADREEAHRALMRVVRRILKSCRLQGQMTYLQRAYDTAKEADARACAEDKDDTNT